MANDNIINGTIKSCSAGNYLNGISVSARSASSGAEYLTTTSTVSGQQGFFIFQNLPDDTWYMAAYAEGYYTTTGTIITQNGYIQNWNACVSSPVTISGKITDCVSGSALNQASVFFQNNSNQDEYYVVYTDSSGNYSKTLKSGSWNVTVNKSNYVQKSEDKNFGASTTYNQCLNPTNTPASTSVYGIVRDTSGNALSGATISIDGYPKDANGDEYNFTKNTTSDGSGNYSLGLVPTATYTFTFSKSGYSTVSDSVVLTPNAWQEVNARLAPQIQQAYLYNGYARDPANNGIDNVAVAIRGPTDANLTTSSNGYFETNLVPGDYTISLTKSGYNTINSSFIMYSNPNIANIFTMTFSGGTPRYKCDGTSCVRDDTNGTYTDPACNDDCTTAAFDFSVSLDSQNVVVPKGSVGTLTATFTRLSGPTESVDVSPHGLPTDITAKTEPNFGNPTFSSVITFEALSTATIGTYPITICGSNADGSIARCANIDLTVSSGISDNGILSITIRDENGNPLPDMLVKIDDKYAKTYTNGNITVALPIGYHTIIYAKAKCYDAPDAETILIIKNKTTPLEKTYQSIPDCIPDDGTDWTKLLPWIVGGGVAVGVALLTLGSKSKRGK